jgi:hypothetical protein
MGTLLDKLDVGEMRNNAALPYGVWRGAFGRNPKCIELEELDRRSLHEALAPPGFRAFARRRRAQPLRQFWRGTWSQAHLAAARSGSEQIDPLSEW